MAAFNVLLSAGVQTPLVEESLDRVAIIFVVHQTGYTAGAASVLPVTISDGRDAAISGTAPPQAGSGLVMNFQHAPLRITGPAARRSWFAVTSAATIMVSVLEEFDSVEVKPPLIGEVQP